MICALLLLAGLGELAGAIRFNYELPRHQIQCFHESVEKDGRYQVSTKGEDSRFYLHVVEMKTVHEDARTTGAEFKQYSAFASIDTIITFCIGNLADHSIYFDVQFYHGVFLEDAFESGVHGRELEDLADRWSALLKMVESNYEIYRRHLFGRRASSRRISLVLLAMVGFVVLGCALLKAVYYRKVVLFLKEKKAV